MKTLVSWSSGKDSAWMIHVLRAQGIHPSALLTTINSQAGRVAMHAVRTELVELQATALGLPLRTVPLPYPCSNDVYQLIMKGVVAQALSDGFTHVAFGDLFLDDIRQYRIAQLAGTGLTPLFPLFDADTPALAREMVQAGLRARITCVDPRQLDRGFAGCDFDAALLDRLPASADPCGERGEFHTFAYDGPMFSRPIPVSTGETLERDGFVFCDLTLGRA